ASSGQSVEWPENVRRELQPRLDTLRAEIEAAEKAHIQRMTELQQTQFAWFSTQYREARLPEVEDMETLFNIWLDEEAPPPETPEPTPGGPETPGEKPPAESEMPKPEPVKEFFAQSSPLGREWIPVGRWTAEMMGPEIFRIPVFNRGADETGSLENMLSKAKSEWKWEAIKALPPGGNHVFRLRRMAERNPVDVIRWPDAAKNEPLVIRTPYSRVIPLPVGFELQAAAPEEPDDPGKEDREKELAEKGVDLVLVTQPPGARIGVDGKVFRLPSGEPARTPCTIRLLPGKIRLTLALPDHVSRDIPEYDVIRGEQRVQWQFQAEADLPGTKARANARTGWEDSGIEVKSGDKVWIVPDTGGSWTVGERGEPCGAEGYSEEKHPHYAAQKVAALKQVAEAPYGGLVARIGFSGQPFSVAGRIGFIAPSSGKLWFDVNESPEATHRRDNRGTLSFKVVVISRS
ncbi:MAG: hypothetical protein U1E27_10150, partial [Kiritimatiellia bacterium]|nr:hypothetical protein [Kiritimatiellia bacterium]